MLIAQLTDTHIRPEGRLAYRMVDTAKHLQATVRHLCALPVPIDAVLLTGDLVDFGTVEEYERLLDLIGDIRLPIYPIPGNHDEAGALRRAFSSRIELPSNDDLSYVVELDPLRLIMVDSTIPGRPHGQMTPERLRWIDAALAAAPDRPALVALHHPPFITGIRHMDVQNCHNAAGLAEVLHRHPQVVAVVAGHVHRSVFTTLAGRAASIGPSPAHAVDLDLDPSVPPSFRMEPPAIHIHCWGPDVGPYGSIVTHLSPIGEFAGPYPFFTATGALID